MCRVVLALVALCWYSLGIAEQPSFEKGSRLHLLVNLHPDNRKRLIYSVNYQLPGLMPVCSEVIIKKKKNKKLVFIYKELEYTFLFDGHTKETGIGFDRYLSHFFGLDCQESQIRTMSDVDQEGIRLGQPKLGMTKKGILIAMGRPPIHANPDIDAPVWYYWVNRFKRKAIEFDDNGQVSNIRL